MPIQILDPATINKIAAGEVIENPASVVKELVENSLDAGATEITVEIRGGGRQLIRVTDDGCGMDEDDAELSLERHATSKLGSIEEMERIGTMGFRGEALPSIASISKFSLLTCPRGKEATLVRTEGGAELSISRAARGPGTTIEVDSLFFNVPVRKKFQRSPAYDSGEILKALSSLALANPEIKFELVRDGKTAFLAKRPLAKTALGKLEERIADVLGRELLAELCPVEMQKEEMAMTGFIALPAYSRPNRTGQHLFINRRAVRSPLVSYAVRDGYGHSLSENRHPLYILHLTLPGTLVDVNVHPQKREVRLREERQLKSAISKTVDRALHAAGMAELAPAEPAAPPSFAPFTPEEIKEEPVKWPPFEVKEEPLLYEAPPVKEEELFDKEPEPSTPKVIGAIPRYILIEGEGLSLIDQRAAHARIIFEKLQGQQIETEPLLIPITLTLNTLESSSLSGQLEELNRMGICIKEFGQNSFAVDALPKIFGNTDVAALIHDLVKGREEGAFKKEREKKLACAASRAAAAGTGQLSPWEAERLVKQLYSCEKPFICPQGKPTIARFSPEELTKKFR